MGYLIIVEIVLGLYIIRFGYKVIKEIERIEKMRDINRIEPFLEEIAKIWKKMPDMRFGQIMDIVLNDNDNVFYMEDDKFLEMFKEEFNAVVIIERGVNNVY